MGEIGGKISTDAATGAPSASVRTDRSPMVADTVQAALARPERWQVHHVMRTRSTNDDLTRGCEALPEPADGSVLVTEEQTAGRGRSGRLWSCPAGAGLMFSAKVSVRGIPPQRRAWVGAALGLAVVRGFGSVAFGELPGAGAVPADKAVAERTSTTLKWPNDVLVGGEKCGGILAESVGESVVVGAGLNVSLQRSELPRADATSLSLAGAGSIDRNLLLAAVLDQFGALLESWRRSGGDVDASGLRPAYLAACATAGTSVSLELPGGRTVLGTAVDVDPDGSIVLDHGEGVPARYSAGDVVHLRPRPSPAVG